MYVSSYLKQEQKMSTVCVYTLLKNSALCQDHRILIVRL